MMRIPYLFRVLTASLVTLSLTVLPFNSFAFAENTENSSTISAKSLEKDLQKAGEDTGEWVDNAAQDTGEATEDAAEATGEWIDNAVDDTGEWIDDATKVFE